MTDPIYISDTEREPDLEEARAEVLTVTAEFAGVRLDRYLTEASAMKLTRAAAVRLIESGCVVLESGEGKGRRAVTPDKNTKLKAGGHPHRDPSRGRGVRRAPRGHPVGCGL